jgi:hypothetical protein
LEKNFARASRDAYAGHNAEGEPVSATLDRTKRPRRSNIQLPVAPPGATEQKQRSGTTMSDWMGEPMNKRDLRFFIGGLVIGILVGVILTGLWR